MIATGLLAGVYGRQEPLSSSSALDKRDLTVVFGLDERIQKKIAFFTMQIALSEEICGKSFRLMKIPLILRTGYGVLRLSKTVITSSTLPMPVFIIIME